MHSFMAAAPTNIDEWRAFFQTSGHDLWTVIDRGITVAALDFPDKLRQKRDGFAEKLFARPVEEDLRLMGSSCRSHGDVTGRNEDFVIDMASGNREAAYGDAAALDDFTEFLEEDDRKEILEIKNRLLNHDKTDADVLECLKLLDNVQVTYDILQNTSIGKVVNDLRKHPSSEIKSMTRQLIRSWKTVADEWVNSSADGQASKATEEECGLPAPPIDEAELIALANEMSTSSMQFMDDGFIENNMASGCSDVVNTAADQSPLFQASHASSRASSHSPMERVSQPRRPQQTRMIQPKSDLNTHRNERPQQRPQQRTSLANPVAARTGNVKPPIQKSANFADEDSRLAAAKRKLQEVYKREETAKKQRTVQVMELQDLPKGKGPKAVKQQKARATMPRLR